MHEVLNLQVLKSSPQVNLKNDILLITHDSHSDKHNKHYKPGENVNTHCLLFDNNQSCQHGTK